jgi:hypothetical protein
MATFPRSTKAVPRLASPPRFPAGLQAWGDSGKGQFRAVQNMGRVWQEIYPVLDTAIPAVRALVMSINRSLRERVIWDVQHPYWQVRKGAGGGTPLVNGADQTGGILVVDGASINITNWLRSGDLIYPTGCPVVLDVAGDVNTNGSGQASIPIHPPIFQGKSPVDNASVIIDPAAIFFRAVITEVSEFPDMDVTRYIDAGMTLTWREQPL